MPRPPSKRSDQARLRLSSIVPAAIGSASVERTPSSSRTVGSTPSVAHSLGRRTARSEVLPTVPETCPQDSRDRAVLGKCLSFQRLSVLHGRAQNARPSVPWRCSVVPVDMAICRHFPASTAPYGAGSTASGGTTKLVGAGTLPGRIWRAGNRASVTPTHTDDTSLKRFRSLGWRAGNAMVSVLARAGIGPIYLLSTRGRRSGRLRTTPVVPVEHAGKRWLVAPYGAVSWVHNARARRASPAAARAPQAWVCDGPGRRLRLRRAWPLQQRARPWRRCRACGRRGRGASAPCGGR
jgi:hypothetical protein